MDFWVNILEKLRINKVVALLYVIASEGSSPGRPGFHMLVSEDGYIQGSVGGGMMEHKLVEYARSLLKIGYFAPFVKHQIHQPDIPNNRSGMICSGQQTLAFYYLDQNMIQTLEKLTVRLKNNRDVLMELTPAAIIFHHDAQAVSNSLSWESDSQWSYKETLDFKNTLYIIGGGHVGLALSDIMQQLGFYVVVADDRLELNTLESNHFAHKIIHVNYDEIDQHIVESETTYVAVVTFGYRFDEICIKRLLNKKLAYLGVMGSNEKMSKMMTSLIQQGYDKALLNKIYTPIGLPIKSKTPIEIAISVAAQIVSIKNN